MAQGFSFRFVRAAGLCAILLATGACAAPAVPTPAPIATATSAPAATATAVPATATAVPPSPTAPPPTTAPATPTTAATPAAAKPATSAAAGTPAAAGEARSALGEIFRGWGGVKTFRAKVEGSLTPGSAPQTAMQMEVVLPDRMRGTINAGGQNLEMVLIGDAAHMKLPTGQWMKVPGMPPMDFTGLDPKKVEGDFQRDVTNVRLVGPEVVDGTPTLAYAYDIAASPATKTGPSTAKIWVGLADRLPRKLEVTGSGNTGKVVITYYDYNAPITIEAPPV